MASAYPIPPPISAPSNGFQCRLTCFSITQRPYPRVSRTRRRNRCCAKTVQDLDTPPPFLVKNLCKTCGKPVKNRRLYKNRTLCASTLSAAPILCMVFRHFPSAAPGPPRPSARGSDGRAPGGFPGPGGRRPRPAGRCDPPRLPRGCRSARIPDARAGSCGTAAPMSRHIRARSSPAACPRLPAGKDTRQNEQLGSGNTSAEVMTPWVQCSGRRKEKTPPAVADARQVYAPAIERHHSTNTSQ